MAKKNLQDYQQKIVEKIRTGENQMSLLVKYCNDRGLNVREVIKNAGLAKSTKDNYERKNPVQFDNLAAMYEAADKMANEIMDKIKKAK